MTRRPNAHVARQKAQSASQCDQLADLAADGLLLKDAAAVMGLSQPRIWQLWRTIREGLGWQAV